MLQASGAFDYSFILWLYRDLHPADRVGKLLEFVYREFHDRVLTAYAWEHSLAHMLSD